jgi:hypothetical protein
VFGELRAGKTKRHVLLVSGDGPTLFGRYLGEAEKNALKIDLDSLAVTYYEPSGERRDLEAGVNVKMGLGQLLSGMNMDQVWKHALRGKTAGNLSDPGRDAKRLGADLVCGGN